MKPIPKLMKLVLLTGLSLSLLACGSSDGGATSNKVVDTPSTIEAPDKNIQILFEEDITEDIRQSVPNDINLPLGLQATLDIEYLGAFRVVAQGQSNSNYAVGTLGFNPDNNSIFMAGHAHHNAIAEFEVPSQFSFETQAANIPAAAVLQDYVQILNKKDIGNTNNKINGILYHDQNLLVSSEVWYDASGSNSDNLQVFSNALDVSSSSYKGMLQLEGKAKAAGYMFKVPNELTEKVGSEFIVGWATNYSIVSRYSQGPSLYRFDPKQAIDSVLTVDRTIDTDAMMVFPYGEGKQLVGGSDLYTLDISPIWGPITKAKYGFIIPGTNYFLAIGQHAGLHSGIGYKITQNNGNLCGGPCPYDYDDVYNYFWLFDVDEMLNADEPWLVEPISYGKWSHPYDRGGSQGVLGGTYDELNKILYLSIDGAGQTGDYDRPPLIISYKVAAKN